MRRAAVVAIAIASIACAAEKMSDPLRFFDAEASGDAGSPWARFDARAIGPAVDAGPLPPVDALLSGEHQLLAFFVVEAGYVLVFPTYVELYDRDARQRARWDAAYVIRAAASDGSRIVIVDSAALTTLRGEDLGEVAFSVLTRACASVSMLEAGRVVCANVEPDYQVSYSVYAIDGRGELGRSDAVSSLHGLRVHAVPGREAFVSTTAENRGASLSENDLRYWSIGADQRPAPRARSTAEVAMRRDVLGWASSPASHAIQDRGLRLGLEGCESGATSCFELDGTIGVVGVHERLAGVDEIDRDALLGLVEIPRGTYGPCTGGCRVVRVDPGARTVESEGWFDGPLDGLVAVRWDPWSRTAAIAGHATCRDRCAIWSVTRVRMEP